MQEGERKDPLFLFKDMLSATQISDVQKYSGSWQKYYREYVKLAFEMQISKVERTEKIFGRDSLKASKSYENGAGRNAAYYKNILGRPLSKLEFLASRDEAQDFYIEAVISYLAKGANIDLGQYATNLPPKAPMTDRASYMAPYRKNLMDLLKGK